MITNPCGEIFLEELPFDNGYWRLLSSGVDEAGEPIYLIACNSPVGDWIAKRFVDGEDFEKPPTSGGVVITDKVMTLLILSGIRHHEWYVPAGINFHAKS